MCTVNSWSTLGTHGVTSGERSGVRARLVLRLIYSCITQLKAQGPSRTCNESKEEEEVLHRGSVSRETGGMHRLDPFIEHLSLRLSLCLVT